MFAGEATFGTEATAPDDTRGFTQMVIHPDYVPLSNDPFGSTLGRNDVAILVLDAPAPVEPVWFRTDPLRPRLAQGAQVVSVGFGLTEAGTSGQKRSAPLIIDQLDEIFLISDAESNARNAGVCSGDSGGPQYHLGEDGRWTQWAVHSWADVDCDARSGSTRVDVVSEWILEQIEAVHGTRDRCSVHGRYADGVCDADCALPDADCIVERLSAGPGAEAAAGCASVPGAWALGPWGLGLWGALALARRRHATARA